MAICAGAFLTGCGSGDDDGRVAPGGDDAAHARADAAHARADAADSARADAGHDLELLPVDTGTPAEDVPVIAPDAGFQTCTSCHGRGEEPAPPTDLEGSEARDRPGVGAHAVHRPETPLYLGVRCAHCHPVPETVDAPGHQDDVRPADVVFSGLAVAHLPAAAMDPEGRCSVYCHGSAMAFEPRVSPPWTSVAPLSCAGGCHAFPPPAPHPAGADCHRCHLGVVDAAEQIAEPVRHIDSVVQAPHGAHIVHLGGAGGADMACTDCHPEHMVHGPLADGRTLEETTLCDPCHGEGTMTPESWREYRP